jgi:hypothetical protein
MFKPWQSRDPNITQPNSHNCIPVLEARQRGVRGTMWATCSQAGPAPQHAAPCATLAVAHAGTGRPCLHAGTGCPCLHAGTGATLSPSCNVSPAAPRPHAHPRGSPMPLRLIMAWASVWPWPTPPSLLVIQPPSGSAYFQTYNEPLLMLVCNLLILWRLQIFAAMESDTLEQ